MQAQGHLPLPELLSGLLFGVWAAVVRPRQLQIGGITIAEMKELIDDLAWLT